MITALIFTAYTMASIYGIYRAVLWVGDLSRDATNAMIASAEEQP